MDYVRYREWLQFLRDSKVISSEQYMDLVIILENRRMAVHQQALAFCNRMKDEHPELWIAYRAKLRILEGVKI